MLKGCACHSPAIAHLSLRWIEANQFSDKISNTSKIWEIIMEGNMTEISWKVEKRFTDAISFYFTQQSFKASSAKCD